MRLYTSKLNRTWRRHRAKIQHFVGSQWKRGNQYIPCGHLEETIQCETRRNTAASTFSSSQPQRCLTYSFPSKIPGSAVPLLPGLIARLAPTGYPA